MRNQRYLEPVVTAIHDSQTDSVDRHRSLRNQERRQMLRVLHPQDIGVIARRDRNQCGYGIDMPADDMTTQPIANPECPLKVHGIPGLFQRQRSAIKGFRHYIHRERSGTKFDHRQTSAVHGDTVAQLYVLQHFLRGNRQPDRMRTARQRTNLTQFLDKSCKHPGFPSVLQIPRPSGRRPAAAQPDLPIPPPPTKIRNRCRRMDRGRRCRR